jgi:hypothetical protein
MKNLRVEVYFIWACMLILACSCRKDRELRDLIGGKNWVLQSGRVYVEELDAPYNKRYYDHFGVGQEYSNLQAFDSVSLSIDSLIQHYTSWSFNSRFVLNAVRTYDYEIINDKFIRVYGLENGSGRVLEYMSGGDGVVVFQTSRTYGNTGGKNIAWFSELVFTENGNSCNTCLPDAIYPYAYSGLVPLTEQNSGNTSYPLIGTSWILQKYRQGFFEEILNDTIYFTGPITYTFNSENIERTYSLSGSNATGLRNFTLFECPSLPSGTPAWTGQIANFAFQQGVVSGAELTSYGSTVNPIQIWMQRVE